MCLFRFSFRIWKKKLLHEVSTKFTLLVNLKIIDMWDLMDFSHLFHKEVKLLKNH